MKLEQLIFEHSEDDEILGFRTGVNEDPSLFGIWRRADW